MELQRSPLLFGSEFQEGNDELFPGHSTYYNTHKPECGNSLFCSIRPRRGWIDGTFPSITSLGTPLLAQQGKRAKPKPFNGNGLMNSQNDKWQAIGLQ